MIVITGAAGFIGSCLISRLNAHNFNDLIAVDDFSRTDKAGNLTGKKISEKVARFNFFDWLEEHQRSVEFIFHIGARTDTAEQDSEIFRKLNVDYSKKIWQACCKYQIPLVYASSAATYGLGEQGYNDNEAHIKHLRPLNPYGESKQNFDLWALSQKEKPFFWAGLKFFNVYGPNEYHKGRMASVILHTFRQINKTGGMKLFRSHNPDFKDGEQERDFIYVKDVVEVLYFLMHHRKNSGIYNLGTGTSRTFLDLCRSTFTAMKRKENIAFIDTPLDIRDNYQYFTQANMQKLRAIGYTKAFTPLEDGIQDYVTNYLAANSYY